MIGSGLGIIASQNSVGAAPSLLLDLYPNAAAAYSLEKIRTDYSGAAIRVRRSSDNAEQDFTPDEITDGTLTTFAGAGDGFVTTWYDQSLIGLNNATQTSASLQPYIVNSGALITLNGKPAIDKIGRSSGFDLGALAGTVNHNSFAVLECDTSLQILLSNSGAPPYYGFPQSGSGANSYNGAASTQYVNGALIGNTRDDLYQSINAQSLLYTQVDATAYTSMRLGYNLSSIGMIKKMQEFIIYEVDQSANRAGIEANINSRYTIY